MTRTAHRLAIAARILRLDETDLHAVQAAIDAMPPKRREHLRGMVNWVEEFEKHEASAGWPRITEQNNGVR